MSIDLHGKGAGFYRQIMADVEDLVRRMLGGINATIAAQKDGVGISDQHRALNFQGAGVTVADDSTHRRTNVFIAGGPSSTSNTIVQSATGTGKVFQLGTEPAGWQAVGFSDGSWSASVVDSSARTVPSQWVTAAGGAQANGATFLLRHSFTPPSGTVVSLSMDIDEDNIVTVWLNGTQIHFFDNSPTLPGYPYAMQTVAVPVGLIIPGAANVLAFKVVNALTFVPPGPYAVGYKLTIGYGVVGTDSQYELVAHKGAVSGYASLDSSSLVPNAQLGSGTPSGSNFLRGDRTWAVASTNSVTVQELDGTPTVAAITIEFPNGTLTDHGGGVVEYVPVSPGTEPYINIQDQKTSGTTGGTFTSGAWQTRTLNTIASDSASVSSLASNQITLPAGTYRCYITVPAARCNNHQARLQNITDSTTVLMGTSQCSDSSATSITTESKISGKFTLSATKALSVQHQCLSTNANGFGLACGFGTEIYTVAEFWKIG